MARFFWICLGGAIGTAARYGISIGSRQLLGSGFPYGTLTVNVLGSFLLSIIMYVGLNTDLISETTRFALGTGVMGGFTTYSSFNYETLQLVQERSYRVGAINLLATLLGCFAAGWLGLATAKWAVGK
jgi:fluoride exporter